MGKIISIINNKGGVGKTSSAIFISELLAWLGAKTLDVDLDEQSNLSMILHSYVDDPDNVISGAMEPQTPPNIAELFKYQYCEKEKVERVIVKTNIANLDIIPCSKRHKNTQAVIQESSGNKNTILRNALAKIKDDYDFIIIDNAPASDILTINSIVASDYVITPVNTDGFGYVGMVDTLKSIQKIKEQYNLDVQFLGAFFTRAESNTNLYKDLSDAYKQELEDKYFQSSIRKDIRVSEIETRFVPILEYAPNTNAVFDYAKLILEMGILDARQEKMLKEAIGEE